MKQKNYFSIITVCFNCEKTIEKTIKSVCNQNYKNYEYIIVDGKSTDNTLEIVQKYAKDNTFIKVESEIDDGIYDAMNKGLDRAEGEWIIFINADDWLEDNILEKLNRFINNNKVDCIYGNINRIKGTNDIIHSKPSFNLDRDMIIGMPMFHQGMVVKRMVYKALGKFDLTFKIASDWDFTCRLINSNYNIKYIDETISNFSCGGISSRSHIIERHKVRKKNSLYKFVDYYMFKELAVEIKNKIIK